MRLNFDGFRGSRNVSKRLLFWKTRNYKTFHPPDYHTKVITFFVIKERRSENLTVRLLSSQWLEIPLYFYESSNDLRLGPPFNVFSDAFFKLRLVFLILIWYFEKLQKRSWRREYKMNVWNIFSMFLHSMKVTNANINW